MGGDERPNDARCVVSANGMFYFCFYFYFFDTNLFFNVYIGYIYVVYAPGGLRWAAMKAQTMPDASFGP